MLGWEDWEDGCMVAWLHGVMGGFSMLLYFKKMV
jgi:hypothetical protein